MWSKVLKIILVLMVFLSSTILMPVNNAQAVGVDTVVKLVGGKAVIRALAEKTGMALSKKQVDNVAAVIEKKTYDGDQDAIDFVNKANNLTSTGAGSKSGFKKYILEPAAWLTGLDLIFEAIDAFNSGYESNTTINIYGQCDVFAIGQKVAYNPDYYETVAEIQIGSEIYRDYIGDDSYAGWDDAAVVVTSSVSTPVPDSEEYYVVVNYDVIKDGEKVHSDNWSTYTGTDFSTLNVPCAKTPVQEDVVDTAPVDTRITNNFDNDTYNTDTTYNVEIELPDNPNYDDDIPWNDKDTRIADECDPPCTTCEPPKPDKDGDGIPDEDEDSDGDGIKDGTDSTPEEPTNPENEDGTNLFENLIPIALLVGLFDLLSSVLMYLVRMFTFILSIPIIPSKPINNQAFEWFREAEIIGVHIYTVVSSLATIGLSFAVYKAIRRLLS